MRITVTYNLDLPVLLGVTLAEVPAEMKAHAYCNFSQFKRYQVPRPRYVNELLG